MNGWKITPIGIKDFLVIKWSIDIDYTVVLIKFELFFFVDWGEIYY